MTDTREAELDFQLARLADGDREAFPHVFKLLHEPILQVCMNILKNDADARDATQEALEKIFERASDYDRRRPAFPWACAIAMWECRTILRRRQRRREVSAPHASSEAAHGGEADIMERELATAAVTALEGLSERDRELLIASFTGTESQVNDAKQRKRRQRAIERLRLSFRRLYGLD